MAGIAAAATSGSRIKLLSALRDNIASQLDEGVPAHVRPPLINQLVKVSREIDHLIELQRGADVDNPLAQMMRRRVDRAAEGSPMLARPAGRR